MTQTTKISSYKGEAITPAVDILIKRHHDGKLSWALPELGAWDTYSMSYLEEFMNVRQLSFKIVEAKEEEL